MRNRNRNVDEIQEDATKASKFVVGLRFIAVSTVVVGGAYLLGVIKGVQLGKNVGRLAGYAQATSDIGKIVKEAKDKVSQ